MLENSGTRTFSLSFLLNNSVGKGILFYDFKCKILTKKHLYYYLKHTVFTRTVDPDPGGS